jgi:hypothetical protein
MKYIEDAKCSGPPKKQTPAVIQKVVDTVSKSTEGRHSTCNQIAAKVGDIPGVGTISGRTVHRVLKNQGFKWVKTTKKPGLKAAMKEARLAFAQKYEHWTLEDWKNVIWSDETSIVLGQRRGVDKVWRRAWEAQVKTCKRNRWKGYSEFMWWSCFS